MKRRPMTNKDTTSRIRQNFKELVLVITKVLMKQGRLTDFDYEFVEQDALAIIRKLKRLGYTIKKELNNE